MTSLGDLPFPWHVAGANVESWTEKEIYEHIRQCVLESGVGATFIRPNLVSHWARLEVSLIRLRQLSARLDPNDDSYLRQSLQIMTNERATYSQIRATIEGILRTRKSAKPGIDAPAKKEAFFGQAGAPQRSGAVEGMTLPDFLDLN